MLGPPLILIVDDEAEICELVSFSLESHYQINVITAPSGNRAIQLLKERPDIELVICDYRMPDGNGGDVFRYLQTLPMAKPFILVSSDRPSAHPEFESGTLHGFAEKPFFQDALLEAVNRFFAGRSKHPSSAAAATSSQFCRIKQSLFRVLRPVPCDVHLKLADEKHVKVLNRGDSFEEMQLARYAEKKVEYFYVKKEDAKSLCERLIARLASGTPAPGDFGSDIELIESVQDSLLALSQALGFGPEVQELTRQSVQMALKAIRRSPDLDRLLARIHETNGNYLTSHSVGLPFIASGLAQAMEWASEGTLYKLTLASFLHDITLPSPALARFRTREEMLKEGSGCDVEKMQAVLEHPIKAASIARSFTEIPPDVDVIVVQHHEQADGSGFPAGLTHSKLAPLSCVFVIAHELLDYFIDQGLAGSVDEFIKLNGERYSAGHFRKIMGQLGKSGLKNN